MPIKAHKIKIKVTEDQEVYFAKACGISRFAYNWGLSRWKENLEVKQKTGWRDLRKAFNHEIKPQHDWLKEVTKCSAAMAFHDLGDAMKIHFDSKRGNRKGPKVQFPVFKRKNKSKDSFCIESDKVKLNETRDSLWVPRLGWVELTEKLRFEGRIGNVRISRKANRWFASIPVEFQNSTTPHFHKNRAIGIDLGLKTSLSLSDGSAFKGPKSLLKMEKKLKILARRKSIKTLGSKNRRKAIVKEARLHSKIADKRNDWQHKVTTRVAGSHKLIVLENLNVSGMLKNHKLAKHLSDGAFFELKRKLKYKAEDRGGLVVEVDTFFPSSKLCRKCGTKRILLNLSERVFRCESQACRHVEDRDLNASRNILKEGQRLLKQEKTVKLPGAARQVKPVEKRASAKLSLESGVSTLVETGRASAHRKNLLENVRVDFELHDQL